MLAPSPITYLTADVPGVGGVLKQRPEDFLVEEIPAYEPCGEGEHIYLFIEKRGVSSMHMVRLLARHFGVPPFAVGVAGLKDRHAITRQLVSIHTPGKKIEDFASLGREDIQVLWADRHTNKLRRGHLAGNRFVIRVRDVEPSKIVHAKRALMRLAQLGVPNRIGEQRFGFLQNNHLVARALVLGDHQAALDLLLGPSERFPDLQREPRRLYAEGKFADARDAHSRGTEVERRVLNALARGVPPNKAVYHIERAHVSFLITALQSAIFNRVLEQRLTLGTFATLQEGDIAVKHDNLAAFTVDRAVLDDPATVERLRRLEVSPSGPMWGAGMMRASGAAAAMEEAALAEAGGMAASDAGAMLERLTKFVEGGRFEQCEGLRRPLRVPLTQPDIEAGVDEHGAYIKCRFELPRGAFATEAMREIMKPASGAPGEPEDE